MISLLTAWPMLSAAVAPLVRHVRTELSHHTWTGQPARVADKLPKGYGFGRHLRTGELRMMRTRLGVFVTLLPGLLLCVVASAASAATVNGVRPAVVLAGSLGRLPGTSALVVVQVGLPYGATKGGHSPAGYHYPAVAEQEITSGDFRIAVPDSVTLRQAAESGHGIVEFNVLAYSGRRQTSQMVPATLTESGANGNRAALAQAQNRLVTVPRFRAFSPVRPSAWGAVESLWQSLTTAGRPRAGAVVPFRCTGAVAVGSPVEDMTRIGEVHVGNVTGLSMRWNYYNTSDTTLSVGISYTSDTGPWSGDGAFTTSNSLGSEGGFSAPRATLVYSDGDMWYQRYHWLYPCDFYTTQVTQAVGDSVEGSSSPSPNPNGSCAPGADSLGYAVLDPHNGFFDQDRAVAWGYSGNATLWTFTFGGHTGFTSSIHHDYNYNNPGGTQQYVCGGGSGMMPDSKKIYSGAY